MTATKISFHRNKSIPSNNIAKPVVAQATTNVSCNKPLLPTPSIIKSLSITTTIQSKFAKPIVKPKIEEQVVVKKRGRPSKEELARREKEKLEKENQIKDQIIQKISEIKESKQPAVIQTNELPRPLVVEGPVFKRDDYVKSIVISGKYIFKGRVRRQDLGSQFVFVEWKDGSAQWHGAATLVKITEKEYRRRERNEPEPEPSTPSPSEQIEETIEEKAND